MLFDIFKFYQAFFLGTRHQLLLSFSVIRNTKDLLDTTQKPIDITCLHGLRFLSMTWVMLGHTVLFFMNNAGCLVLLNSFITLKSFLIKKLYICFSCFIQKCNSCSMSTGCSKSHYALKYLLTYMF